MSKSRPETCIDPLDMIKKYGADAMRLSLVVGNTAGNDSQLSEEKIKGEFPELEFNCEFLNVSPEVINFIEVGDELEEMRKEVSRSKNLEADAMKPHEQKSVGLVDLLAPRFRMATMLSCGLQVAQQLSGINAIMFYSGQMFENAQVPPSHIQYAICSTGLVSVVITILTVLLVNFLNLYVFFSRDYFYVQP